MTSYEKYLMSLDEKKYLIDNNISLERTRETTLHLREENEIEKERKWNRKEKKVKQIHEQITLS